MNEHCAENIAGVNRRQYYWDDLSQAWLRFQKRQYNIKEFCRLKAWPDVEKLFYRPEIKLGLERVVRWQAYANSKIWPQSSYKHTFGLVFLAFEFLSRANGKIQPSIDKELIIKTCVVHDIPEGLGLGDVPAVQKSAAQDIEEYLAFQGLIDALAASGEIEPREIEPLEKIYLLQFCCGETDKFPRRARFLMSELRQHYGQEILWFRFLENIDYLLYAESQYVRFGEVKLIKEIAPIQLRLINDLKSQIDYLQSFWTPEVNNYFSQFL